MTETTAGTETAAEGHSALRFLRDNLREYGILIALVVIMAFFQIATDGILLKPVNLTNLILQNSYIVIMAVGMLLVIVSGHIDLSVGSVMGFIGAVIGAFIMGVMNNGMSILGIGIDYQQVIKGLVLLAAVIFDVYNKNKV